MRRCIGRTCRRYAVCRCLERISKQGIRLWNFLHLTTSPFRRDFTFVYLNAIDPHSRLVLPTANVIFEPILGRANDISLLRIESHLGSQRVVPPIDLNKMQMRRLCREAYLCQEKGREGDLRCLGPVASEGYCWPIVVSGMRIEWKL